MPLSYIVSATEQINCDRMEDISPTDGSRETAGLTSLLGDANVCAVIPYQTPSSFLTSTETTTDLKEYLSRPRVIRSANLPVTRGRQDSGVVSLATLQTTFPSFSERLWGTYAIRFTIRISVQIAATPFQQGLLALAWQYNAGVDSAFEFDRGSEHYSVTHLPHVRLNFQKETTATLEIPFLHTLDYFPLRGGSSGLEYGHWSLVNLVNSYVLPTTALPVYKIYFSLHDLELLGATPWVDNSIFLTSGLEIPSATRVVKKVVSKLAAADSELRSSKLVSTSLSYVSKGLDVASKIPLIGSFTGTPSWLVSTLSKAAASFGYAAPSVEVPPSRMLDNKTLDPTHIDIPIASSKLSNFQSNKIEISEALGACAEDQMSFAYVLSKPSYIYTGSISTSTPVGSLVYGTKISPASWYHKSSGTGNTGIPYSSSLTTNAFYPSTLFFVADSFRYWRGGVRFTITFAKTAFHGGHVLATFVPYNENAGAIAITNTTRIPEITGPGGPQPNGYSTVFDLRAGDSFTFDVPFIGDTPYVGTFDSTGGFSMIVMNKLVTSSAEASTTIDFMVEISALDDFEFAVPVPSSMARVTQTSGVVIFQSGMEDIELQSGMDSMAAEVAPVVTVEPSATIIGEKFNSLKQLAMIPYFYAVQLAASSVSDIPIPFWQFQPSWTMATPMSTTASNELAFANSSKVASMYVFSNGSTRFTALANSASPSLSMMSILHKGNVGNLSTANYSGNGNVRNKRLFQNGSTMLVTPTTHTVDVPMYSRVQRVNHALLNSQMTPRLCTLNNVPSINSHMTYSVPFVSYRNVSGNTTTVTCSFAAGEDATAACFIGPPPCILFNSAASVDPNGSTQFVEV